MVSPEFFTTLNTADTRRVFTREELSSKPGRSRGHLRGDGWRCWPGQIRLVTSSGWAPTAEHSALAGAHEVLACRTFKRQSHLDDGPFYYRPPMWKRGRRKCSCVSGDTRIPATAISEIVRDVDPQMAVTDVALVNVERQGGK